MGNKPAEQLSFSLLDRDLRESRNDKSVFQQGRGDVFQKLKSDRSFLEMGSGLATSKMDKRNRSFGQGTLLDSGRINKASFLDDRMDSGRTNKGSLLNMDRLFESNTRT